MLKIYQYILDMSLKITNLGLHMHLSGAGELNNIYNFYHFPYFIINQYTN